jgi:hypothetical protein
VVPEPAGIRDIQISEDDALILAVQCHARGWKKLALELLERSGKPATRTSRLNRSAWDYWKGHLSAPKIDRAPIGRRLKALMRQDRESDTEANRGLLRSLDLALAPRKSKPGSIEALIDDLVDGDDSWQIKGGVYNGLAEVSADAHWNLAKRGFEAVPALIDHLDDERLTRSVFYPGNNHPGEINLCVQHLVSDLLRELAWDNFGGGLGNVVEKDDVRKWWAEARKKTEEAYLLDRVFPPKSADGEPVQPRVPLLNIIIARYPGDIPALYRKVLDQRTDVDPGSWAFVIENLKLPKKDKLDLFLHAAGHKEWMHRVPALAAIRNLDRKRFNALLLPALEELPRDVSGPYWICSEAGIADLVPDSDDPRVWAALEKAAKRASVGLRMELLGRRHREDKRQLRAWLRLLGAFLEDATARDRDVGKQFEGPHAGFFYPYLEVRNFAAMEILEQSGVKVEVRLRDAMGWAEVRRAARTVLNRELGEKK